MCTMPQAHDWRGCRYRDKYDLIDLSVIHYLTPNSVVGTAVQLICRVEISMIEDIPTFQPVKFSTDVFQPKDRLPVWREEFGRKMVRVDIAPRTDAPFRANATLRMLPGVRTVVFGGSPVTYARERSMLADGDDSIGLVVNLKHAATVSQGGRQFELGVGAAFPILSEEPAVLHASAYLGIIVPRAALGSRIRHLEDSCKRSIPRRDEALRLLTSYLRSLSDGLTIQTPAVRDAFTNHVHDLLALTLDPARANTEGSLNALAASRLSQAFVCMGERFADPDLSIAAVARQQKISPRYLQRLIETTGTTFTSRLLELRLQRAFALLTEARNGKVRISDVALSAGFSDISHFNRQFRARFGDTPSGVLAQHVGAKGWQA
jgi:AraC-like DNA-binding protein